MSIRFLLGRAGNAMRMMLHEPKKGLDHNKCGTGTRFPGRRQYNTLDTFVGLCSGSGPRMNLFSLAFF